MEKSRSYFLLFLLIFFKTSLTIITKIDKTTTIIHAGKESLTSFKISLSGVKQSNLIAQNQILRKPSSFCF